jgi:SH3-like domain-containing protein
VKPLVVAAATDRLNCRRDSGSLAVRAAWILIGLLAAGTAVAQTAPTGSQLGQVATPHAKAAKPKHTSKTSVHGKTHTHTPVVAPHHGATPRKPVHPKTPLAHVKEKAAKAEAAKPVPKPVPKPAPAKPQIPPDEGTVTHLHIPRYVSLKSDEVNMRSGPGERYPVLWTYKRRELPVKIEREFDVWRLVEDMDGIKGWVHQATLAGRRTFVVTATDPTPLRADADDNSEAVAILKPGVVGRIRTCDGTSPWCQVQVQDYRGWLKRASFWGTDASEAVVAQ